MDAVDLAPLDLAHEMPVAAVKPSARKTAGPAAACPRCGGRLWWAGSAWPACLDCPLELSVAAGGRQAVTR